MCHTFLKLKDIIKHKTKYKSTYRKVVNAINQLNNNYTASTPIDPLEESIEIKTSKN